MQDVYLKNKKLMQQALSVIIKNHRLEKNKSISLISDEIGMTKSMWADLEKAIKDPQLSTLWRVSEALDVPISTIITQLEESLGDNFTLIN